MGGGRDGGKEEFVPLTDYASNAPRTSLLLFQCLLPFQAVPGSGRGREEDGAHQIHNRVKLTSQ